MSDLRSAEIVAGVWSAALELRLQFPRSSDDLPDTDSLGNESSLTTRLQEHSKAIQELQQRTALTLASREPTAAAYTTELQDRIQGRRQSPHGRVNLAEVWCRQADLFRKLIPNEPTQSPPPLPPVPRTEISDLVKHGDRLALVLEESRARQTIFDRAFAKSRLEFHESLLEFIHDAVAILKEQDQPPPTTSESASDPLFSENSPFTQAGFWPVPQIARWLQSSQSELPFRDTTFAGANARDDVLIPLFDLIINTIRVAGAKGSQSLVRSVVNLYLSSSSTKPPRQTNGHTSGDERSRFCHMVSVFHDRWPRKKNSATLSRMLSVLQRPQLTDALIPELTFEGALNWAPIENPNDLFLIPVDSSGQSTDDVTDCPVQFGMTGGPPACATLKDTNTIQMLLRLQPLAAYVKDDWLSNQTHRIRVHAVAGQGMARFSKMVAMLQDDPARTHAIVEKVRRDPESLNRFRTLISSFSKLKLYPELRADGNVKWSDKIPNYPGARLGGNGKRVWQTCEPSVTSVERFAFRKEDCQLTYTSPLPTEFQPLAEALCHLESKLDPSILDRLEAFVIAMKSEWNPTTGFPEVSEAIERRAAELVVAINGIMKDKTDHTDEFLPLLQALTESKSLPRTVRFLPTLFEKGKPYPAEREADYVRVQYRFSKRVPRGTGETLRKVGLHTKSLPTSQGKVTVSAGPEPTGYLELQPFNQPLPEPFESERITRLLGDLPEWIVNGTEEESQWATLFRLLWPDLNNVDLAREIQEHSYVLGLRQVFESALEHSSLTMYAPKRREHLWRGDGNDWSTNEMEIKNEHEVPQSPRMSVLVRPLLTLKKRRSPPKEKAICYAEC
ncbi:hypothetical protein [Thalassoroseus pseudoceratinae]|uniref:hypothetical protein n=1 Tax=Thalassoroseus pseudoceratinae TaxID=2713176 RepID=UPI00141E14D0|nr:hypothetical protein [Thalassoroseus pseudoceratinae]